MRDKASTKIYHPPVEKDGPLTRDDVLCPVCWSVLIEPVTFPCAHSICLVCFRNTIKEACLTCPCCRVRISNWSRRAEKSGTLVNQPLWGRIQAEFPKFVKARLEGQDSQDILEEINNVEEVATSTSLEPNGKSVHSPENESIHNPTVESGLDQVHKSNEQIKNEIEEEDAKLIHKMKTEDGFGTQQLIFEDDSDQPNASEGLVIGSEAIVRVEPVHSSQNRASCNQGKTLCRNLFSEWEMRSVALHDKPSSTKFKAEVVTKKSSSQNLPSSIRKRINWKDCDSQSADSIPESELKLKMSERKGLASCSQQLKNNRVCSPNPPCLHVQQNCPKSSFVTVYSPRLMTSEVPQKSTNGVIKLPESSVFDTKLKQLDHLKRSHFQSSDTPDSINIEVNSHFRPIRSAPRTPPKQLPDGSFLPEPKLVKSTPTRLGTAPAALIPSMFQREKTTESTVSGHSNTSTFCEDSSSDSSAPSSVVRSIHVFSPPPPPLVHYAFQGVSPNGYSSDTQEDVVQGRVTGPPPELEAYGDVPDDGLGKERRISEIMYRQVQAYQLEQFRKRKLQEDNDRDYAERLQRELNKQNPQIVRTRGSSERYSIRTWGGSTQSSSAETEPSSTVPARKYPLRTTRARNTTEVSETAVVARPKGGKVVRKRSTRSAVASSKPAVSRRRQLGRRKGKGRK